MSLRQPDLERQAREFAGELSELLNGTVTHGVRLRSYMDRSGRAVVGCNVSEVHRSPDKAVEALRRDGWQVIEPDA